MRQFAFIAVLFSSIITGCNSDPPTSSNTTAVNSSISTTAAAESDPLDKLEGPSRDLKEGVLVSDELANNTHQRQVLIYYVNEPHAAIYRKLQGWTQEFDDADVRKAGERLGSDLEQFPAAVEKDLQAIKSTAPPSVGVAIFSNELVRDGKCLIKPIGSAEYQTMTFEKPEPKAADKRYHPVSDSAVFAAALALVAKQFNPADHDFALITKAHGAPDSAMATLFGHVMGAESSAEMMAMIDDFRRKAIEKQKLVATNSVVSQEVRVSTLSSDAASDKNGQLANENMLANDDMLANENLLDKEMTLDPMGDNTLDPMGDNTLDPMGDNTLDPMGDNTLAGKALLSGMTKKDYFNTLAAANEQHGLRFGLVFLEACKSELKTEQATKFIQSQPNDFIGILYTSDQTGLRYNTIEYEKMFEPVKEQKLTLIAGLRQHLDEIRKTQEHIPAKGELPAANQ